MASDKQYAIYSTIIMLLCQWLLHAIIIIILQGGPKKSKPDNFCNNFVYCQPISIIFGTYTL